MTVTRICIVHMNLMNSIYSSWSIRGYKVEQKMRWKKGERTWNTTKKHFETMFTAHRSVWTKGAESRTKSTKNDFFRCNHPLQRGNKRNSINGHGHGAKFNEPPKENRFAQMILNLYRNTEIYSSYLLPYRSIESIILETGENEIYVCVCVELFYAVLSVCYV